MGDIVKGRMGDIVKVNVVVVVREIVHDVTSISSNRVDKIRMRIYMGRRTGQGGPNVTRITNEGIKGGVT